MNGVRLARNLSAGAVAGIAAWSSYSHMVGVALHYGERPEVAYVLPASVDGMLIVASVAMADDKRTGRKVRTSARIAFVAGVAASLAANVAHAQDTIGARIVAAWPAVALLLVVEILSRCRQARRADGRGRRAPCTGHGACRAGRGARRRRRPSDVVAPPGQPQRSGEADAEASAVGCRSGGGCGGA